MRRYMWWSWAYRTHNVNDITHYKKQRVTEEQKLKKNNRLCVVYDQIVQI